MKLLDLSICIVLYRSESVVDRFLHELRQSLACFHGYEILFYDNSPTDSLRLIVDTDDYWHDPRNLGFSYANNELILRAKSNNLLLLNPDVFGFTEEFWDRTIDYIAREVQEKVTFVKLLNPDGSHQDCVGEPVSLRRAFRRTPDYSSLTERTQISAGIMAFLLTTRAVFARVGLLDCDYSLYGEDMDWSYRARRQKIELLYEPTFVLTHLGGASTEGRWSERDALKRKYLADDVFIDKHARGLRWFALKLLNRIKVLRLRLAVPGK